MNFKKFICLLLCLVAVVISLVSCSSPAAYDYQSYNSDTIIVNSDWIIVGEIVKVNKPEKINMSIKAIGVNKAVDPNYILYTVSEIKVLEVIKGDLVVGDIIKIKQIGNEKKDPYEPIIKGNGYLKKGVKDILFLQKTPDTLNVILNPSQGVIEIKDNKTKSNDPLFKSDISKDEFVNQLKEKVQYFKDNPYQVPTDAPRETVNKDFVKPAIK